VRIEALERRRMAIRLLRIFLRVTGFSEEESADVIGYIAEEWKIIV
jgi:hypothetical protein